MKGQTMKIEVNIQVVISTENINSFSDISEQINKLDLNKAAFIKCVQELDHQKTEQFAGVKYSRNATNNDFSRAGTITVTILTDYGRIPLTLNRVKDKNATEEDIKYRIVLEELYSKGSIQLTEKFKDKVRKVITHMTYRRATEIVNLLVGMGFNKDIIWEIVKELDIPASVTYDADPKSYDLIMVDGSGGKGKHVWYAFVGLNSQTGEMIPLHHSVGFSISEIKKELENKRLLKKHHIIVADGETDIHKQFNGYKIQMCAFHFEQNICYACWKDGMPLEERKEINKKIQEILNKLKNSVRKNTNCDHSKLELRIQKTKDKLSEIANELSEKGYSKGSKVILKHFETLTLFAKEAINLVKVPWTNNIMERFIGEITFRIKNIWAHWSKEGLNTIIYLVIQRYCKRNRVKLEF